MIPTLTWKNKGQKWTIKFYVENKRTKLRSGLGSNIRQTSATIGFQHCGETFETFETFEKGCEKNTPQCEEDLGTG